MQLSGKVGVRRRLGTDCYSPIERSWLMSRIRSRGNKTTELRFIQCCREFEIVGWRRGSRLFGRPDFVFCRARIAVFVDGDFWHGNPKAYRTPKSNSAYWSAKIEANRRRDRLVNRTLRDLRWRVVRIWESDLRRDPEAVMTKLSSLV